MTNLSNNQPGNTSTNADSTDLAEPSAAITTERIIPATPQQIFAAFARPDQLAQWWGPKDFTNTFQHFEFKPGGKWIFEMHSPNGESYHNESIFRDIQPDSKIVIEHIVKPWFRLTITLTPHGNHTHLAWHQEFETPEIVEKMRPLSKTANEQNLDRLQALLAKNQP